MTIHHVSDLHEDLASAIAQVEDGKPVLLESANGPLAALVSPADMLLLEAYWEELEQRSDVEAIREARAELARETAMPYEEFRRDLGL